MHPYTLELIMKERQRSLDLEILRIQLFRAERTPRKGRPPHTGMLEKWIRKMRGLLSVRGFRQKQRRPNEIEFMVGSGDSHSVT